MIKIEKMKNAIQKWGDDFIERVFNEEEICNIYEGRMYYQRLAARFAAKEAVIKATSKNYLLDLKDILILNKGSGVPYCEFKKKVDAEIFLSITHIEDYAIACAVAQKET